LNKRAKTLHTGPRVASEFRIFARGARKLFTTLLPSNSYVSYTNRMTSSNAASAISSDRIIATDSAAASSEDMKRRLDALLTDFPDPPPLGDIRDYLSEARNNNGDNETTQQLKQALLSTNFLHHFIGLLDEAEGEEDLALVTEIMNIILDVCPDCVHTVLETEENYGYYNNTYPLHIACQMHFGDSTIFDKIINLLLDKCSNDDNTGGLDHIAAFGCCDSVLENYDNVGGCPLTWYVTWGGDDMDIVRQMVNLCPASLTLSCDKTKMTPLNIMLRSGDAKSFTADVVKLFIETDASCVKLTDNYGCYPLHCLCIQGSDLEEDEAIQILDTLLDAYPEAAFMKDKRGIIPLNYALWEYRPSDRMGQKFCKRFIERTNVDANAFVTQLEGLCSADRVPYTAIQAMIDDIPRVGVSAVSERVVASSSSFLFGILGCYCEPDEKEATIQIIQSLLDLFPEVANITSGTLSNYRYPIHDVCCWGAPDEVIKLILSKTEPKALQVTCMLGDGVFDGKSRVPGCPLHYYIDNIAHGDCNIDIVKQMVEMGGVDYKVTPLHCLCMNGDRLNEDSEDDAIQILDILLDACPQAVFMKDKRGIIPLHHALWEYSPSDRMGQKFCRRFIERSNVDANAFVTQLEGLCSADPMPYTAIQAMIDDIPRLGASAVSERMVGSSSPFLFDILGWCCESDKKKVTLQIIQSLLHLCPEVANITSNVHCPDSTNLLKRMVNAMTSKRQAAYPIHAACCWGAQDEVIKLILSKTEPKALQAMCVVGDGIFEGWTKVPGCPLHYYTASGGCNIDIVKQMVEMGGVELLQLRDSNNKVTPLQALLTSFDMGSCQDVVEYMIKLDPTILQIPDKHGRLPIHSACANGSLTLPVLQVLVKLWPESVFETLDGYLPLHILCMNR
jgi:ankyrin repeat protein